MKHPMGQQRKLTLRAAAAILLLLAVGGPTSQGRAMPATLGRLYPPFLCTLRCCPLPPRAPITDRRGAAWRLDTPINGTASTCYDPTPHTCIAHTCLRNNALSRSGAPARVVARGSAAAAVRLRGLLQYEFRPLGFPIILNPAINIIDSVGRPGFIQVCRTVSTVHATAWRQI